MPRVKWDDIEDQDGATIIPDGEYLCRVKEVTPDTGNKGEEVWRLDLEITSGDYGGEIIFDRLFFTEKGLKRVKLVCNRLGIETTGEADLRPSDLIGKDAYVTCLQSEYVARDGSTKKNMKIPFDGYKSISDDIGF